MDLKIVGSGLLWCEIEVLPCIEVAPKYTGEERAREIAAIWFEGEGGELKKKRKTNNVTQDSHNDENKRTRDTKRMQNRKTQHGTN